MRGLNLLLLFLLLIGCARHSALPPVVELKWHPQNPHKATHVVRRGETLYAVAFRYDNDFRELAVYNHLHSPYTLRVGQVLRIKYASRGRFSQKSVQAVKTRYPTRPVSKKAVYSSNHYNRNLKNVPAHHWFWPAKGRVVATFIPTQGKKGIDIAGNKGALVQAAANGVVAYAGSGLSGYGNLIIIKHDGQFLTAYGNNLRNRVVEGQRVKAGQIIAEMGIVDRKFWGVHFEIRKAGQPVNPMDYLR